MNKRPEQTEQTRQSLVDAFWELAFEMGPDRVTVSAVTKRAGINRGTFYVYFLDLPDLLEQVENDMICDVRERMGDVSPLPPLFSEDERVSEQIVEVFSAYDDKLFLLLGKQGDPLFRERILAEADRKFRECFPAPDTELGKHILTYHASAVLSTLIFWHENGRTISPQQLEQLIHDMGTGGLKGLLERYTPTA